MPANDATQIYLPSETEAIVEKGHYKMYRAAGIDDLSPAFHNESSEALTIKLTKLTRPLWAKTQIAKNFCGVTALIRKKGESTSYKNYWGN